MEGNFSFTLSRTLGLKDLRDHLVYPHTPSLLQLRRLRPKEVKGQGRVVMGTQPVLLLQRLTFFPKRGLIDVELMIIVPDMENLLWTRN